MQAIAIGDEVTYTGKRGVVSKFASDGFVVTMQDGNVVTAPFGTIELYVDPGTELNPTNWLGIIIGGLVVVGGVGAYVWYKHRDTKVDSEIPEKTKPVKRNPLPYLPPDVEEYVTLHFKMMPHHIRYARGKVSDVANKTVKKFSRSKK